MAATLCQVMGLMISLLGLAGTMAATAMDQWATQDLSDSIITAVYSYSGLWRSCFRQSSGLTECRPYYTILGLPGNSTMTLGTHPMRQLVLSKVDTASCCFSEVEKLRSGSLNSLWGILCNYRVNLLQKVRTFLKSWHLVSLQRLQPICWSLHHCTFIDNLFNVKCKLVLVIKKGWISTLTFLLSINQFGGGLWVGLGAGVLVAGLGCQIFEGCFCQSSNNRKQREVPGRLLIRAADGCESWHCDKRKLSHFSALLRLFWWGRESRSHWPLSRTRLLCWNDLPSFHSSCTRPTLGPEGSWSPCWSEC